MGKELNFANRQVCDCDIRSLKDDAPFLFFDSANVTTVGFSGESVYANKKGGRAVAFQNPLEGTVTIEAQVIPFKFYAMLSNGKIETDALKFVKKSVKCTTAGELTIPTGSNETLKTGTLFVYKDGEYGGTQIEGTLASGTFTATTPADLAVDSMYDVGFVVSKTSGVKRISFNDDRIPEDYKISMTTLDKAEDGTMIEKSIIVYKATVNRDFEMSFSSEGDPVSLSITFTALKDKDGNIIDMIQDDGE